MKLNNKVVLVTGAGGTIGSELCKQLLHKNVKQVKCLDSSEYNLYKLQNSVDTDKFRLLIGDVKDKDRLNRAVKGCDIVIHAAALKHVSFCEYNPDESVKTNIIGSMNLIDVCVNNNVKHTLFISTDKAVDPSTVMGTSKLMAEKIFINAPLSDNKSDCKFSVVRFGNVFGSAGSVVETFVNKIKNDKIIKITHPDMIRYFMSTPEAVDLVLDSIQDSNGGEIFILKMKKVKILDLAKRIHFILKGDEDIEYEISDLVVGEKLDEHLISEYEKEYSDIEETDKYFIIKPMFNQPHYKNKVKKNNIKISEENMTTKELDELIKQWGNI